MGFERGSSWYIKQEPELSRTQPTNRLAGFLIQSPLDELSFLFLQSEDPVLDSVWYKYAVDVDGLLLPDAVGTINGLLFDVWIPEWVENNDLRSYREIQTSIPGF